LISGGTIVLADNPKLEDAVALFSFVRGVGVQVIDLIPSRWDSYLRVLKRLPIPELRALLNNELRFALSASEPLKCETVSEWRKVLPSRCRFINMYGATETCGITSVHSVDDAPIARTGFVPIGRPIPGIEFTALNVQNEPVNDGDSGVLHISGPTLADGYVGERASNDRSPQINGVRTINIGDLVRKNASGSWEHLGRVDDQIKIHGTRIEPREIELALCGHPSVRECALSGQIGEGLVMYVAAEGATSAPELRHYLSTRLPVYMVPVRFEFVQRLPRTLSGKIDRRSLMQIAAGSRIASAAITPVQRKLTEICADALSRDDIDIRRSLVEFGADSITLSEIVARVRLEFRVKLAPSAFLSDPTIEKIAALISNSRLQTGRTDTKAAPNTRGSW
jgi:acyl-coenzyme A synthetase/AMP-(fatty) acid ligase/acyl carrier protein